jgi:hypothetical protein
MLIRNWTARVLADLVHSFETVSGGLGVLYSKARKGADTVTVYNYKPFSRTLPNLTFNHSF